MKHLSIQHTITPEQWVKEPPVIAHCGYTDYPKVQKKWHELQYKQIIAEPKKKSLIERILAKLH